MQKSVSERTIDTKRVVNVLVNAKLLTPEQGQKVLEEEKLTGDSPYQIITKSGFATEEDIVKIISQRLHVPAIDLANYQIDESVLKLISYDFASKNLVIPIKKRGHLLTVAVLDPQKISVIDDIKFMTGHEVEIVLATESALRKTLEDAYGVKSSLTQILESIETEVITEETKPDVAELAHLVEEAPVVKFVNGMINEAIRINASDIHIEPYEKNVRVRFRVDGILHDAMPIPLRLRDAVVSRIKVMAKLDIAERRLPQDGHIKVKLQGRTVDLRISTLPILFGEKVVMRILDKTALTLDLIKLGLEGRALEQFKYMITRPYGLILVTGPTGSGKTTTLYSAVNILNTLEVNIITIEDPVEYDFPGVNQVQVKEEIDLTFASSLRSFLRQDPDIILVGEIRDNETVQIAIRAALTGHLVLSTLHTNDAPSAISRLVDMGAEPFLVAASLRLVIAQRLVRKICPKCKIEITPHPEAIKQLALSSKDLAGHTFYQGEGCKICNNRGYAGRIGIYEVMPITPKLRELIIKKTPIHEVKSEAVKDGMMALRDAAIQKFLQGITTIDEVIRVTSEE